MGCLYGIAIVGPIPQIAADVCSSLPSALAKPKRIVNGQKLNGEMCGADEGARICKCATHAESKVKPNSFAAMSILLVAEIMISSAHRPPRRFTTTQVSINPGLQSRLYDQLNSALELAALVWEIPASDSQGDHE